MCTVCSQSFDHQVTSEDEMMSVVAPLDHIDGYIKLVEDDSTLFHDPATLVPSKAPSDLTKPVPPELLWYMDRRISEQEDRMLSYLREHQPLLDDTDEACPYRFRATDESKKASPALLALIARFV